MAGIYVHIPFCEKKCIYCDFYSITNNKLTKEFLSALCKEFDLFSIAYPNINRKVETIYLGGGTPSLLEPNDIELIIMKLESIFDLSYLKEFTIECNPGTDFVRKLPDYKTLGINRISIGVQSLDDNELKFLGRIHNKEEAIQSIEHALKFFDNVSVDIIFSLPNQTKETLRETLNQILSFNIKHISAYSLIYEEGTPLFFEYQKGRITPKNEDEDFELYKTIQSILSSNGFMQYEVSNFAKPGYKSIHNLGYWQHKEYYGFGPSAHSFFNNQRQWNVRNLQQYLNMLAESKLPIQDSETITSGKRILEKIMLGLRSEGISFLDLKAEFGVDIVNEYKGIIQQWIDSNKAILENGWLKLTSDGYFICDKLTLDLIEQIEKQIKERKSFQRV